MRKIIERLPPKLQSSWRHSADRILSADKREVCIEDIASFVEEKSRAQSNPNSEIFPSWLRIRRRARREGRNQNPRVWAWS